MAATAKAGNDADDGQIVWRQRRDVEGGGPHPLVCGWVRHGERRWRFGGSVKSEMLADCVLKLKL